jgi:NAD+ kinase
MKIKLIHNPLKHWTREVEKELRKFLVSKGHRIVKKHADATVCIGGDGTILFANYKGKLEGNILGIGSKRSFICQLRKDSWKKRINQKLKEKTVDLQILEARLGRRRIPAINDVVVHTTDYRVVEMEVRINGRKYWFEGDGIIVSSAVGSSSYAYSAGGKRLDPKDRRIEIVPIAPYRRKFKSKVLNGKGVRIRCDRESAVIVDGIFVRNIKKGETIRIKKDGTLKFYRGVGFYGG